jgi:hypothetical protein
MSELLDVFVETCQEAGVERLQEHGISPGEYRESVARFVQKSLEPNLAMGKAVALENPFSPKYNPAGEKALTDGLRGIDDYNYNWLGFEGEDMVAVIDFGEEVSVTHLSSDFLQFTRAWIFLPKMVIYYVSEDGVNFQPIGRVTNPVPDFQPGLFIIPFSIDIPETSLRYLKVEAKALKTCPEWHIGAGRKSWIFTDEIVVR